MDTQKINNQSQGIIRLSGINIDGTSVSCTGVQLAKVLNKLEIFLDSHIWFIADISSNGEDLSGIGNQSEITRVDSIDDLINISIRIDQYWSGIFIAVPIDKLLNSWKRSFFTEDEPTTDLESAVLEIRAFDSTYFEIYSSDFKILQMLSETFKVPIEEYD